MFAPLAFTVPLSVAPTTPATPVSDVAFEVTAAGALGVVKLSTVPYAVPYVELVATTWK